MAGMAHRSYSGPPETFSLSFSLLYPWIHGLFPAIEFAVVPSPSLPNSGDPRATLARASLNSGDLTAAERSSAARSRSPLPDLIPSVRFRSNSPDRGYRFMHALPWPASDPLRPIQIKWPEPRVPLRARAPCALGLPLIPSV
jgi:hypothetical protein